MEPGKIYAVAIRCLPTQRLDRDLYMSFLGDRIQEMVDAAPDPEEAVAAFQEAMFSEGLLSEVVHCPTDDAGNTLYGATQQLLNSYRTWGFFNPWTKSSTR